MPTARRLLNEQTFHDVQATERARVLRHPATLRFTDDAWLDHETWIRPAFRKLGNVAGLRVLDLGCGHGMATVVLARRGALVTAMDLSPGYLAETRRRCQANGVEAQFVIGDGDRLPFAEGSFDRVWGNAVLHHLDLVPAGKELRRVLALAGWAVFCEPWGENPLLNWARRRLPYPAKSRTPDEHPLRRRDLCYLADSFPDLECEAFQLLEMARRVLGPGRLAAGLQWCDTRLLRLWPALRCFCRYVVLTLRQPGIRVPTAAGAPPVVQLP
jgi:SAM-dependent methyltransferase